MKTTNNKGCVPQFQVRSNLAAGASVEACLNNLAYWQKEYYNKCGRNPNVSPPNPMPYGG